MTHNQDQTQASINDAWQSEQLHEGPTSVFEVALAAMSHLSHTETAAIAELGAHVILGRMLTGDEHAKLRRTMENYRKYDSPRLPAEFVIDLMYTEMRSKLLSWEQAAAAATRLLGKEIKPDALRVRVARWAKDNGRPAVEMRKPSPVPNTIDEIINS